MEVSGIFISLFLLMYFAYRGYSVILFAPVFALLAASFSGLPVMPAYTGMPRYIVTHLEGEKMLQGDGRKQEDCGGQVRGFLRQ